MKSVLIPTIERFKSSLMGLGIDVNNAVVTDYPERAMKEVYDETHLL